MDNEYLNWLEFAKTDLGVANHLNDKYYPRPLAIICYHCQQAAEKAIKALIIYSGAKGGVPQKHNLSFLLDQMKNMYDIPEKYYDYADTLTPYGIAVRYPNELPIDDRHVKEAIRYSAEIIDWIEMIVKQSSDQ